MRHMLRHAAFRSDAGRLWLAVALVLLAARTSQWAAAELWYDEVITLTNFCGYPQPRPFWSIFRHYPMANNHFLSTAITWIWLRLLPDGASEQLLRLPSLLLSGASLALIVLHWRKSLGQGLAGVAGVLFAVSPVTTTFAWQIRGYALSLFLSTLAISALIEYQNGQRRRGQILLAIVCFCQPLVMASAVIFAPVTASAILVHERWACGRPWRAALAAVSPGLLAGTLGGAYYLTLGGQFRHAALDAGGIATFWWTARTACQHVAVAMLAHGWLPLLMAAAGCLWGRRPPWREWLLPATLAGSSWLIILAIYGLTPDRTIPFPRNFLLFFPVCTYAALLLWRQTGLPLRLPLTLPLLLLSALLIERASNARTRTLLAAGELPQNLLQQHYRGAADNRAIVHSLRQSGLGPNCVVVVSNNDEVPALWYWLKAGYERDRFKAREEAQADAGFWRRRYPHAPLLVWSRRYDEAIYLFRLAGYTGPVRKIQEYEYRTLYSGQPGLQTP